MLRLSLTAGLMLMCWTSCSQAETWILKGTLLTPEASGELAAVLETRKGMLTLISPDGLGRFHVLLLGKGVTEEQAREHLSGLKYHDVV